MKVRTMIRPNPGHPRLVLAALALVPLHGFGQALDRTTLVEVDDDDRTAMYQDISVDQLEDMSVERDGAIIGEVEEVLANANGEIVALVIEYGGNAIGIGDKEAIAPIETLRIRRDTNRVETTMTDAELDALTPWDD